VRYWGRQENVRVCVRVCPFYRTSLSIPASAPVTE
jgi:hypothetical protein